MKGEDLQPWNPTRRTEGHDANPHAVSLTLLIEIRRQLHVIAGFPRQQISLEPRDQPSTTLGSA